MRNAFISELTAQAAKEKKIILLTADLGYSLFEYFAHRFPKQFINVGIAEATMMSVAAGLAKSGNIVFVYSIATFATLRPFEQIRNDICMPQLPVTIIGSGAGLSYSDAGPTHHATEDIAILRTLPNISIFAPSDPIEVHKLVKKTLKQKKPAYIRLGKRGEPVLPRINHAKTSGFDVMATGRDFLLFATGNIVANCFEAVRLLKQKNITGTLICVHTLKPISYPILNSLCQDFSLVISAEEHTEIGGLGSIIAEAIMSNGQNKPRFIKIALPDTFTFIAGTHEYVRNLYGLSSKKIADTIEKNIV